MDYKDRPVNALCHKAKCDIIASEQRNEILMASNNDIHGIRLMNDQEKFTYCILPQVVI